MVNILHDFDEGFWQNLIVCFIISCRMMFLWCEAFWTALLLKYTIQINLTHDNPALHIFSWSINTVDTQYFSADTTWACMLCMDEYWVQEKVVQVKPGMTRGLLQMLPVFFRSVMERAIFSVSRVLWNQDLSHNLRKLKKMKEKTAFVLRMTSLAWAHGHLSIAKRFLQGVSKQTLPFSRKSHSQFFLSICYDLR